MFSASREFVLLSLDGFRELQERCCEDGPATVPNAVDHYRSRPKTPNFNDMTLLQFVQQYKMPEKVGAEPVHRNKDVNCNDVPILHT